MCWFSQCRSRTQVYAQGESDAMFHRTASLCLPLVWCIMTHQNAKLCGVANLGGGCDPKFEFGRDCFTIHLPQVSSSCVYLLGSYCTDKHTHKQTDSAENIQSSSLCYDVGKKDSTDRQTDRDTRLLFYAFCCWCSQFNVNEKTKSMFDCMYV